MSFLIVPKKPSHAELSGEQPFFRHGSDESKFIHQPNPAGPSAMTSAIRMDYAANPSGDEAGHFAEHVVGQARTRGGPYRPSDRHAAEAVDRGGEADLPVAEGLRHVVASVAIPQCALL